VPGPRAPKSPVAGIDINVQHRQESLIFVQRRDEVALANRAGDPERGSRNVATRTTSTFLSTTKSAVNNCVDF
jgi:hypothetical protein